LLDENGDGTGVESYGFAVDEAITGITIEIPHDYAEGTNLSFHVHWQGNAAPTGTDYVNWQITYVIMRKDTTLNPAATITKESAFDTQYESIRSDFTAVDGSSFLIGDQVIFTLTRIAAAGDAYAGDAVIGTVGFHYQTNSLGSRTLEAK
jgi:hypothetical protein